MKHISGLATLLVLCAALSPVQAQSSLEEGHKVLHRLRDAKVRKALTARVEKLSLYVGRIRVGSIEMETIVAGKALILKDSLQLRVVGLGQVSLESKQTIDERGQLVEASLSTRSPQATGKLIRRTYTLRRKGAQLLWRKTVDKKSEEKMIDAAPNVVALVPPVGLSARLPKLITAAGRLTFVAIDMKTGSPTRLRLGVEPFEDHIFRGQKLSCRLVNRREAGATMKCLVDKSLRLLQVSFAEKRLKAAGGRTPSERFENLPEAFKGVPDDPASTVILFFRNVAKGIEKDIKESIDFDSLFAESIRQRKKPVKGEREAFKRAIMKTLSDDAWLRDKRLSINSGAMELSDLKSQVKGKEARVYLPGGGGVRLKRVKERWKIAGFIAARRSGSKAERSQKK
jgi:hypothetical protein